MGDEPGYVLLRRGVTTVTAGSGEQAKPGSGATITLWDTDDNNATASRGARYKRYGVTIYSSHLSAAAGLKFQRYIGGNWRTVYEVAIAATTVTETYVAMLGSRHRITYENAANVLTTWECEVFGDTQERAA